MARASKIGSVVYRALPAEFRQYWMYKAFVGEAIDMLKNKGMKAENVLEALWKTYVEVWEIKKMMNEEVVRNNGLKLQRSPEMGHQPVNIRIDWKLQIELPVFEADDFLCMQKGIHGARAPS